MDANNIKVVLSYGTAITSISNVRIDTIVIDITAITSIFFPSFSSIMDIQFISYPTDPSVITFY
jgi:hypothetical protein